MCCFCYTCFAFSFLIKKRSFQHALPQKFQRGWPNVNKMLRGHHRKKGRETQKADLFVTTLTKSLEVKQCTSTGVESLLCHCCDLNMWLCFSEALAEPWPAPCLYGQIGSVQEAYQKISVLHIVKSNLPLLSGCTAVEQALHTNCAGLSGVVLTESNGALSFSFLLFLMEHRCSTLLAVAQQEEKCHITAVTNVVLFFLHIYHHPLYLHCLYILRRKKSISLMELLF